MTVAEGLWDERRFIEHCAGGVNYKTGAAGWARDLYFETLRPQYRELSKLKPSSEIVQVVGSSLELNAKAAPTKAAPG